MVLSIYKCVMFYFFFVKKQKKNRFKKVSWPKFCNTIFLFLLKVGSVGPADQQIHFVLSEVFPLKFICDHVYITIIHKSLFNWNITSSPYLEMLKVNMIKSLFSFFLIDCNVQFCFLKFVETLTAGDFHTQIF